MRIFPTFPPRTTAEFQPIKTLIFFLVFTAFLIMLGPALVYPAALLMVPAVLLLTLTEVGLIAFSLCTALSAGYAFFVGGVWLGGAFALAVVPALLVGALCLQKEKPFVFSLAASSGALFVGGLLALGLALYGTDGQLAATLAARLESLLQENTYTDAVLIYGYAGGLLPLTNSITVPALALPEGTNMSIATQVMGSNVVLNPEAREELLRALLFRFETGYSAAVPGQLLSGSILGAVLMQLLSRRALRARGENVELPGLRQWFIPRGKGRLVAMPMVIAWVWMQFFAQPQLFATYTYTSGAYIAFSAFSAASSTIFALQGLALLDFGLHKAGSSRMKRIIFAMVGYVLLRDVAVFVGMAEQYFDFRLLRRTPEDENDDFEQEDDF